MSIPIFVLLSHLDPRVTPEKCKIHLATHNGEVDPLDEYRAGRFDEWQCLQGQRNFERPFVVSLIRLGVADRWLFAGVHRPHGHKLQEGPWPYKYQLSRIASCDELDGRLIVQFKRPSRQAYLNAERWFDQIVVAEITP